MASEAGGGLYYPDGPDETAPDPSAILAGIEDRRAARRQYHLGADPVDFSRLLAAVEAALKLADGWETKGGRLYGFDDRASRTFDECTEGLREAITSALTGKEGGEDE